MTRGLRAAALWATVLAAITLANGCTAGPTPHPGNGDVVDENDATAVGGGDLDQTECEEQFGLWDADEESCVLSPAAPNTDAADAMEPDADSADDADDANDSDDADDANDASNAGDGSVPGDAAR